VVATALPSDIDAVLEIVIDGLTEDAVRAAMVAGIREACAAPTGEEPLRRISAGNFGGKLGPFHFHLRELVG
jgi:formylmethanofuran--tetrahydromethanopterin N-formyltransferase